MSSVCYFKQQQDTFTTHYIYVIYDMVEVGVKFKKKKKKLSLNYGLILLDNLNIILI